MSAFSEFLNLNEQNKPRVAKETPSAFGAFLSTPTEPSGATIETALDMNPDQEARNQALSLESGYPVETVREQAPVIEKRLKGAALRKALRDRKFASEWFAKPENAAIAHDDVDNLSYIENIAMGMGERVGTAGRGAETVLNVLSKGPLDPLLGAIGLGDLDIPGLGTASVNTVRALQGKEARRSSEFEPLDFGYKEGTSWEDVKNQPLRNIIPFGIEQGLVSIPDMALAMASLPTFAGSMTGRVAEERAINEGREEPTLGDLIKAAPAAVSSAFLERLGARGMLGVDDALKEITTKGVAKAVGKGAGKEAVTEGAQEGLESLGGTLGTEQGFDGGQTLEQMLAGAVGGGVFGGGIRGVTASSEVGISLNKARQAKNRAAKIVEINEVESKLRARNPAKFAEFKGGLLRDNGIQEVSVSADALREFEQSGGDMTWADSLGVLSDGAFETAEAIGGEIELTPEQFAMMPAEVQTALAEDLRFNGEMSAKEAVEFETTGIKEEFERLSEQLTALPPEGRRDADAIQSNVEEQLLAAGRSQDEATYGAVLMAQRYATRAARTGQSALELYQADNLIIAGPDGVKQAPVDDLSLALDALRSDADMQKVLRLEGSTILDEVKARGGIDPSGRFASELAALGITPKEVRGLFKEGGASSLDNIPASEIPFFAEQFTDEGAFVPEQSLLDAIEQEATGGRNLTADEEQTLSARSAFLDDVRDTIERSGLTLESSEADIRAAIEGRQFEQAPAEDTDAFKAWFGDSQVVNENGSPLIVHHGGFGIGNIEQFNADFAGDTTGNNEVGAFHFVDKTEVSDDYARQSFNRRFQDDPEGLIEEGLVDEVPDFADLDAQYAWVDELAGNNLQSQSVYLQITNPVEIDMQGERIDVAELEEIRVALATGVDENGVLEKYVDTPRETFEQSDIEDYQSDIDEYLIDNYDVSRSDAEEYMVEEAVREVLLENGIEPDVQKYDGIIIKNMIDDIGEASNVVADQYIAFDPTQIKSVNNQGTFDPNDPRILFQPERGSIQFTDAQTIINLGAKADPTTFLHESGHFFLEQLSEDAAINEELAADWSTVQSWWGKNAESLRAEAISYAKKQKDTAAVKSLEGMSKADVSKFVKSGDLTRSSSAEGHLSRAMHEQWARSVEDYFRTGRAPSLDLQSAFNHFRAWLVSIYSAMKRRVGKDTLDAQFSPEVQAVMDRLIATDEEIETIEEQYNLKAMFGSAEEIGMTPSQFKDYQKVVSDSIEEAKTKQLKKHLNEIERARKTWWLEEQEKIKPEVADVVAEAPVYQALHALTLGSTPQGEALDGPPNRLNKADVIEIMGSKEALKRLPRVSGRAVYATSKGEGSVDPEVIASLYGFGSPDEMLKEFANTPPFDVAVDAAVDARMKADHGDMGVPQQALNEALESTRNDKRGDVLAAELNALREGQEKLKTPFVREWAKEKIGAKKVDDLKPQRFVSAEKRHGKEAGKALRAGDRVGAQQSKFRQLMNFFMSHEAYKARTEVDKAVKYMKKFGKRGAKFPTIDADYVDQIKGILENYNLAPRLTDKKRTSLMEWAAKEAEENGAAIEIPEAIQRADGTQHYRDLTLDEFRTLRDTIKNIETQGRRVKEVMLEGKRVTLQEAVNGVVSNMDENLKDSPRSLETSRKLQKMGRNAKGFGYLLVNPDTILREMDGWQNLGASYMAIKANIDKAMASDYLPRQGSEAVSQKAIYDKHYTKSERLGFWKQKPIPGTDLNLSKQARLSVALNSGNADNARALVESGQFTQSEIDAVLDTLDERDWKFVQDNWDYIDSFWPEISAAERERHGVAPKKVEAEPVQTKYGEVAGGYYPLKYDGNASVLAGQEQAKQSMKELSAGRFAAKQTSKGHTKERTGSGGRPVLLDLGVVPMHVDKVIYDLALSGPVNDANRVLNHKDTRTAFEKKGHLPAYEQLNMWLEDVASGELRRGDAVEAILRHVRVGFTTSKLAWNVSTALLQPLGIIQTSAQIGKMNTIRGVTKMLSHSWVGDNSIFEMVKDQSDFMKIRGDTYNKDITEAHKLLRDGIASRVLPDQVVNFFDASFFYMMTKMQRMVDVATWLGAQQQGLEEFDGDIEKANFHADRMVARAQASGIFTDRTSIERGSVSPSIRQTELVRSFTALISYFMAKNNVALERIKKTDYKNPLEIVNLATDMTLLYAVEAVLVGLIRGQFPDGDEDDALDQVGFAGHEAINTLLAGVPFLREFASEANGFSAGGVIGSVAADFGKLYDQVGQGEIDEPLVKGVARLGGTLFKFPTSQPIKTGAAIAKALDGEDVDYVEYLMGPRYDR